MRRQESSDEVIRSARLELEQPRRDSETDSAYHRRRDAIQRLDTPIQINPNHRISSTVRPQRIPPLTDSEALRAWHGTNNERNQVRNTRAELPVQNQHAHGAQNRTSNT
jgi:hypothetical protein